MSDHHPSLVFGSTNTSLENNSIYERHNEMGQPIYTFETRKNEPGNQYSRRQTTRLYRVLGPNEPKKLIGEIELRGIATDIVIIGEREDEEDSDEVKKEKKAKRRDIRPATSVKTLGLGDSKVFEAVDGRTYAWKWKHRLGWRLRDTSASGHDIATVTPGPYILPMLNFLVPVTPELEDDIVLTMIFLEQRRRKDESKWKAIYLIDAVEDFKLAVNGEEPDMRPIGQRPSVHGGSTQETLPYYSQRNGQEQPRSSMDKSGAAY